MFQEMSELPVGFDGEVRLFPLPDLVFFPSNAQPLHIFESRYREMLEDAIQGDRLICMATLEPGFQDEYYSRPPVAPQVCIGSVNTHKRRDDGTYDLILVGYWRALIVDEISPVKSYRRAKVEVLSEEFLDIRTLAESPHRDLVTQLAAHAPLAEELIAAYTAGNLSLNGLTDIIAFHIPFELRLKLSLLAETDPIRRAESLLAELPKLDIERPGARRSAGDEFPPPFSSN